MTHEVNGNIARTINDVPIKVSGVRHLSFLVNDIDINENMYNENFLFEMDGIKFFYSGDITKDALHDYIAANKKWTDTIDIAFL